MQSRAIRVLPVEELLAQTWAPEIDEAEVQRQVEQYCVRFKAYRSGEVIDTGDIAAVELQSDNDFFNRNLKINVGKGFFNRELEKKLMGLRRGETSQIHHSVGEIVVTVRDIQRLVIPELTDELVQRGGMEGISTAAEYLGAIRRKLAEEQIAARAYDLLGNALASSKFSVDEAEIAGIVALELDRCRRIAREQGKVFDEMSRQELLDGVGQPDIPSFKQMVAGMAAEQISVALVYLRWRGRDEDVQRVKLEELPEMYGQCINWLIEKISDQLDF